MTPRSKKAKPSFDVARGPLGDTAAGWVYRSPSSPETSPESPASGEIAPTIGDARATERHPMARRVESGADLVMYPFTLSLMMLFAKMRWFIGPRAGR